MTTYTINLDDVDLAFLPLRTHSYNNFLKKEYFQFQVMKEPVREPADTTYTCHICAIDVPAAFAREHATSTKHRANARIASVATQRTRAFITALPPPACAQPTARFCANCATIVDEDHDRTKEHRVAAMHDNLLWELMKAYVGDDDSKDAQNAGENKILNGDQDKSQEVGKKDDKAFKDVNENNKSNGAIVAQAIDINQPTITTENREAKTANCENNDKNIENLSKYALDKAGISNDINKIDSNQSTNSVQPTTSGWVKLETKKVVENGTSQNEPQVTKHAAAKGEKTEIPKEPYEKELRKFMDTNNVFQIKEMYHRVYVRINEDTVNVHSDHFHGFHRIYNNGKVECIVCNKIIVERDTDAHKYELNHMSVVAKIGDDGNYVRKINETYSHCIVCNQKINNINVAKHKQSQHHNQRKAYHVRRNAVKPKEATSEKNNNEVTGDKTENNPNEDVTMKESVEINKHPYKIVSGELQCVVCDCRVPRDLRNREEHLKGLRHTNNLKTK